MFTNAIKELEHNSIVEMAWHDDNTPTVFLVLNSTDKTVDIEAVSPIEAMDVRINELKIAVPECISGIDLLETLESMTDSFKEILFVMSLDDPNDYDHEIADHLIHKIKCRLYDIEPSFQVSTCSDWLYDSCDVLTRDITEKTTDMELEGIASDLLLDACNASVILTDDLFDHLVALRQEHIDYNS